MRAFGPIGSNFPGKACLQPVFYLLLKGRDSHVTPYDLVIVAESESKQEAQIGKTHACFNRLSELGILMSFA